MARRGKGGGGRGDAVPPVIVKRIEEAAEAGHHGGAWKIAYADFVTAMMAFFLLMWLVNATTEAQRRGIADYFAPHNPLGKVTTGSGQPFGGRTLASEGQMISDGAFSRPLARVDPRASDEDFDEDGTEPPPRRAPSGTPAAGLGPGQPPRPGEMPSLLPATVPADAATAAQAAQAAAAQAQAEVEQQRQREVLRRAAEEIRAAVRADPALAEFARQLLIEEVPEGLRIQAVDSEGQAIFALGQAAPNDRGRALLQRAAAAIARLPHPVEITGHTDAAPFRGAGTEGRSNWELSAERANATRRLMLEAGVAEARLRAVAGRADRELLRPEQPLDPSNRRVAVLVLIPAPAAGAAAPAAPAAPTGALPPARAASLAGPPR